jgi:hypothetical protein
MRLGLLGPFEVFLDAVPQRLPGRGERALPALLALSVGRVVATTTLVDQLWPSGALPEDPQNASQIRASKLRRALTTAAGADVIVRHGTGYWLSMRFGRDAEAVPVLREAIEVAARAGVYNTVQWVTADLGLALLALGLTRRHGASVPAPLS